MTVVRTWLELTAEINKRTAQVLSKDVAPILSDALLDSISSEVYSVSSRKGRGQNGGLADKSLIDQQLSASEKKYTLSVYSSARPQPSIFDTAIRSDSVTIFSEWIDGGSWMDIRGFLASHGQQKPKRPARPFIDKAQQLVNSKRNQILNIIEKGIR